MPEYSPVAVRENFVIYFDGRVFNRIFYAAACGQFGSRMTARWKVLQIAMVVFLASIVVSRVGLAEAAKSNHKEKNENNRQENENGRKHQTGPHSGEPPAKVGKSAEPPRSNFAREISDRLALGNSDQLAAKSKLGVSAMGEVRVFDNIAVSGFKVPPSVPVISVTSAPILQASANQPAEITFHSTSAGTYSIEIKSEGRTVQTLEGSLELGANSKTWNGRDWKGVTVPAGDYSYYITAMGSGGVRSPPAEGDGAIVFIGAATSPQMVPIVLDPDYMLVLPVVAAAGAAAFFFLRRRAALRLYLPIEASSVIDDVIERYPSATIEDYAEHDEGGMRRYRGVTIRNADPDDEWIEQIVEKTKEVAGVNSVSVNYRGKMHTL
jgi:hypothetical protein